MHKSLITVATFLMAFTLNANEILWRTDKNAQAYCNKVNDTVCTVLVNNISTDVSAIENKNIVKLGITPKAGYEKVITFPSKWLHANKDGNLIEFTTRVWLKGQRYTIRGMVFVDSRGKYVHQ